MQNEVYHYKKKSVLKRVLHLLALLSCSYAGWNLIDTGKYNYCSSFVMGVWDKILPPFCNQIAEAIEVTTQSTYIW